MGCEYLTNCVNSDGKSIRAMVDTAITISRRTFMQNVNQESVRELEASFGYASHHKQGLTMAQDWHVSYHRSKYRGRLCYYFKWSGIEYIFVRGDHGQATGGQSVQRMADCVLGH